MRNIALSIASTSLLLACSGGGGSGGGSGEAPAQPPVAPPSEVVPSESGVSVTRENPLAAASVPTEFSALRIEFLPQVGGESLICSDKSEAFAARSQVFTDVRMFISNLRLVSAEGKEVPLRLDQIEGYSNLQYRDAGDQSIALLNFLDESCHKDKATKILKSAITGDLPQGRYTELRFELGLPYPSRDELLTQIPAPLAPSDMAWMWNHYPAHFQISMSTPEGDKTINALTLRSTPKSTIALPLSLSHSEAGRLNITADLGKIFDTAARDAVAGFEGACFNKDSALSSASTHCAYAYKALGLPVGGQPSAQTVFSIAP